jgi:hypothetical protein
MQMRPRRKVKPRRLERLVVRVGAAAVHDMPEVLDSHQRLLEQRESLDAWEQGALARAAGAFERIVTLDPARPIQLILRISRGAPPSTRSLRRPVDDVLAFAA